MTHLLNILFLIGFGSFLHFAYGLADHHPLVAPFAALDESVWEHGKLLFWPAVLLTFLYGALTELSFKRLALAVATGTAIAIGAMIAGFYAYTAMLGDNLLFIDLSLFAACVIGGYAVGTAALRSGFSVRHPLTGYVLLAILGAGFVGFSYWKPPLPLFHDTSHPLSTAG